MDSLALRLIQPRGTISEVELNPELNIARSSISIQAAKVCIRKPGKFSGGIEASAQARIKPVEVRMVEEVEHFRAELNTVALFDLPILGHRKINVLETWLPYKSTLEVTKLSGRG